VSTGEIGPYELLDQVGAPDGTVWRARDQATGAVVAIRPHPAAPDGTYVVQDWVTGAGIGTLAIAAPAAGAIVAGGLATGAGAGGLSAGAAGSAAGSGAGLATGGAGVPTAAGAGTPAAAGATPVPVATSGASGTAAHAGSGGGSVGAGQGLPGTGGHAGVSASKGVVGHIVAHKFVAAVAAVVVAGGITGTAVLVAAGSDDEQERRVASDKNVGTTGAPTATGSTTPTDGGTTATAPTTPASPTMREEEVAAAEIEGRYNTIFGGGEVAGTSIPAGSGESLVLEVISDCKGGPCTVRVTDGKDSLSGTGSYDDGAWSGDGTYTSTDVGCTSPFRMTLTPAGRNLTLVFRSSDFCGYGPANLRWTMSPIG
jgi:hypothetical protein